MTPRPQIQRTNGGCNSRAVPPERAVYRRHSFGFRSVILRPDGRGLLQHVVHPHVVAYRGAALFPGQPGAGFFVDLSALCGASAWRIAARDAGVVILVPL